MMRRRVCGCLSALLLWTGVAAAQNAPEVPAFEASATPPKISYEGGQLKIEASDISLADLLNKVAELTGVKIDIPSGATAQRMTVVQLGPGPAREVLASLLEDSNFDYLIQASDTDPNKIQAVLVMARDKRTRGPSVLEAAARNPRRPFGRPGGKPDDSSAADDSAQPEPAVAEVTPTPDQTPPTVADQPSPAATAQPGLAGQPGLVGPSPGAMAPPSDLSPKNINLQLQQMYQQRAQMQQSTAQPATPPSK